MKFIKNVNIFNVPSSNPTMDASKKFVATEILVFDFELLIGDRCGLLVNIGTFFARSDK